MCRTKNIVLRCVLAGVLIAVSAMASAIDYTLDEEGKRTSRISDESAPVIDESIVPTRPKRLEWGSPFLGTGTIKAGHELPGGAILQPSLLIFGALRTAIQTFKNPLGPGGEQKFAEWANRLDIFANLQLTGTERILLGMQPLHDRDLPPTYSGVNFHPENDVRGDEGFVDELNANITTLFFEGDLGEIFPNVDLQDFYHLDLGISIGRQPLFFQEGFLINDTIDAIGLIRNNLIIRGGSNLQFTLLYGWKGINRADNVERGNVDLFGLFVQADLPRSTVNVDVVYTNDSENDDDGLHWGLSATQRIGHYNTAFHILGSHTVGTEQAALPGRPVAAVDDGVLLWSEASYVLPWTEDNVYVNVFWGINSFSSAARGPSVGGPLGRHGLSFASIGLGRYTPALANQVADAYGLAMGYQKFLFGGFRKQILFEIGARDSTRSNGPAALALLSRYQQAFGQRTVLQLDAFYSHTKSNFTGLSGNGYGLRTEILVNF